MKLISPAFLEKITTSILTKQATLWKLFENLDPIELVMKQKDLDFQSACDWIAIHIKKLPSAPAASLHEKELLMRAAKQFTKENCP